MQNNAEIYSEIADREWQQEGLMKIRDEWLKSDEVDFFTMACPGAGKTRFAISAIKLAFDANAFDLVVVVAPRETLRTQWVNEASKYGIALMHYSSDDLRESIIEGLQGITGIVTTYQQLCNTYEVFEHWCESLRVMLVSDEIHHCANEKKWGESLEIGFSKASLRLSLSGTPFRSDEGRIPFLMEPLANGGYRLRKYDAEYSYGRACNARVCRVMTFPRINARIQFEDDHGVWTHRLDEPLLDDKERNRVYRAALSPDACDFSRVLLEKAWKKTIEIREKEQQDAALLVIARDQGHAKRLQELLHVVTGRKAELVISDEPKSQSRISRFKSGKAPAIISVQMFAEGVDAPRIRVIAFLTAVKTEMWFRQIVGRAVRMQNHVPGDQWAYMFIPKIPAFEEMARRIEEEISYEIKAKLPLADPDDLSGFGGSQPPLLIVHGSDDERLQGFIAMGNDVEEQMRELAEEMVDFDPVLKRFTPEYVAAVLRFAASNPQFRSRFEGYYASKEEQDNGQPY